MRITDVGNIQSHLISDAGKVLHVSAVFGNKTVDDRYVRACIDEFTRKIRSDEPCATGDKDVSATELGGDLLGRHGLIVT